MCEMIGASSNGIRAVCVCEHSSIFNKREELGLSKEGKRRCLRETL